MRGIWVSCMGGSDYFMSDGLVLRGPRVVMAPDDALFPAALSRLRDAPKALYVVGNPAALSEGIAVVGARKATPYGVRCAKRFSSLAAERGVVVVSGGARGCDAAAHEAAIAAGGTTIAFLGGGCDRLYPAEHQGLFQRIVDSGGAVVSEQPWEAPPMPWMFRMRNRLIAGLARATLIVEAGLPSGTFSTADEALAAGREVLVVPGSIASETSHGANRLICQGATPIIDDETFLDALFLLFGCLREDSSSNVIASSACQDNEVVNALRAAPMGIEELYEFARERCGVQQAKDWLMPRLAEGLDSGQIARYPDGRWGPTV